jgi:hypothetical protein
MNLHQLADELLEIRRYVRDQPKDAAQAAYQINVCARCRDHESVSEDQAIRWHHNICFGAARAHCNPEVLRGYLYGAAQEIRELAMKQEAGE